MESRAEEVNHENRREEDELEMEDVEEDDDACSDEYSSNMDIEDQFRSYEFQQDMAQEQ